MYTVVCNTHLGTVKASIVTFETSREPVSLLKMNVYYNIISIFTQETKQ